MMRTVLLVGLLLTATPVLGAWPNPDLFLTVDGVERTSVGHPDFEVGSSLEMKGCVTPPPGSGPHSLVIVLAYHRDGDLVYQDAQPLNISYGDTATHCVSVDAPDPTIAGLYTVYAVEQKGNHGVSAFVDVYASAPASINIPELDLNGAVPVGAGILELDTSGTDLPGLPLGLPVYLPLSLHDQYGNEATGYINITSGNYHAQGQAPGHARLTFEANNTYGPNLTFSAPGLESVARNVSLLSAPGPVDALSIEDRGPHIRLQWAAPIGDSGTSQPNGRHDGLPVLGYRVHVDGHEVTRTDGATFYALVQPGGNYSVQAYTAAGTGPQVTVQGTVTENGAGPGFAIGLAIVGLFALVLTLPRRQGVPAALAVAVVLLAVPVHAGHLPAPTATYVGFEDDAYNGGGSALFEVDFDDVAYNAPSVQRIGMGPAVPFEGSFNWAYRDRPTWQDASDHPIPTRYNMDTVPESEYCTNVHLFAYNHDASPSTDTCFYRNTYNCSPLEVETVAASPDSSRARVSWPVPSSNAATGPCAPKAYLVDWAATDSSDAGAVYIASGSATSYLIQGLQATTEYVFGVTTYNEAGTGGVVQATATTNGALSAPGNLEAVPVQGAVDVSWSHVAGAGHYVVQCVPDCLSSTTTTATSIRIPVDYFATPSEPTHIHVWGVDGSGQRGEPSSTYIVPDGSSEPTDTTQNITRGSGGGGGGALGESTPTTAYVVGAGLMVLGTLAFLYAPRTAIVATASMTAAVAGFAVVLWPGSLDFSGVFA